MHKPKIALTIAGTDPTGGAGVMADLKSFHACGVYGMATITSIVAQNTLGVQHIHNLETSWVKEQLDSVFDDELPQAIKTGMIATKETMELIQSYLKEHSNIPYVIDPVMLAKSGDSLMDDNTKIICNQHYYLWLMLSLRIYLKLKKLLVLKLTMKKVYVKQVKSLLMKLVVRAL